MNESVKIENSKPIFAAIYARTSTPNQRFNYSIREQISSCWKYCNQRDWVVKYVFVDEGKSGETIERPRFQDLLEKAKNRSFDIVIFWKLDRFARSVVDIVNTEKALRESNVGLCSVTEYIDTTTSVGRFNFRSIASVGELERELIGQRARLGLYALAKEHKWPNCHPPLGYERSAGGSLKLKEDEAKLVRRIFEMYLQDKSMPQVAFQLNKEHILTKKGNEWNAAAVRDVLNDELYIGIYNVAGVTDIIEEYRILEDSLFMMVRETRLRYKEKEGRRPPMPSDRRKAKISKVIQKFLDLLRGVKK
jgi:site-specific DNA recombinase